MNRVLVVAGILMIVAASPGLSQDGPRVVKMTVSPAPASKSPIPFPLLPHLRDIKPGNAAVFYQRSQSFDWWGSPRRKEVEQMIETLEQPWTPDIPKKFSQYDNFGPLNEIEIAARCEYCDWQLLERLRSAGTGLQIPDQQAMRSLGGLNAVRVRFAIHRGDFDTAARGLQTHFAMAKHVGEAPLLISYLIGSTGLARIGQDSLEEWVQQPEAPSLYWALTDLPQPLIDWRRSLESEVVMYDREWPEIRQALHEANPQPVSAHALQAGFKKLMNLVHLTNQTQQAGGSPFENALVAAAAEPYARAYFLSQGRRPDEIDRLPVTQVVAMYWMARYDRRAGEVLRLQNLPYWQARPFLKKFRDEIAEERSKKSSLFDLENAWLPAFDGIFAVRPRIERRFAMLRHIEALRLYAAQHRGQWPDSLDDIRDLPLPVDPYTGKAFSYRRDNKTAILEAFAPPGMAPTETNWIRYELTLRAPKTAE